MNSAKSHSVPSAVVTSGANDVLNRNVVDPNGTGVLDLRAVSTAVHRVWCIAEVRKEVPRLDRLERDLRFVRADDVIE